MKGFLYVLLFTFYVAGGFRLSAQTWEAGPTLGMVAAGGDLAFAPQQSKILFGADVRFQAGRFLSLAANASQGWLAGQDNFRDAEGLARGFSFKSRLTSLNAQAEWHFFGKTTPTGPYKGIFVRPKLRACSPYLLVGLGATFARSNTDFNRSNGENPVVPKNLIEQDAEAARPNAFFTMPIGAGLRLPISKKWSFLLETSVRPVFSDWLDGIHAAANPEDKDWYATARVGLQYRFAAQADRDRDGTPDRRDVCPGLAGPIALKGCPDRDLDGLPDPKDACPTESGPAETRGCPDRDLDGVPDKDDECPGAKGSPALHGCPDHDNDGVAYADDHCPTEAGPAALNGCPDRDLDAVADVNDACPEVAGLPKFNGCPDADEDGTPDKLDACPEVPGPSRRNGCPETMVANNTETTLPLEKSAETAPTKLVFPQVTAFFAPGSAQVSAPFLQKLADIAHFLNENPACVLHIEGHADKSGNERTNRRLSEDRAQACFAYLRKLGVAESRMRVGGFADTKPVAENNSAAGREQNRRVEFIFK